MSESVSASGALAVREKRLGRTPKLTPEIQDAICQAVSRGVPMARAARLVEIEPQTIEEWVARGEGRHPDRPKADIYERFALAIEKAKAEDQQRRIRRITEAAEGGKTLYEKVVTHDDGSVVREVKYASPQWQADAWVLERTDPDTYGMRARMDVSVQVKALIVKVSSEFGLTPDQLLSEARDLLKSTEQHNTQVIDMRSEAE